MRHLIKFEGDRTRAASTKFRGHLSTASRCGSPVAAAVAGALRGEPAAEGGTTTSTLGGGGPDSDLPPARAGQHSATSSWPQHFVVGVATGKASGFVGRDGTMPGLDVGTDPKELAFPAMAVSDSRVNADCVSVRFLIRHARAG